jgi:hypothetical protein
MQTLLGMEAIHTRPALLCSAAAAMRLAGCNAVQRRNGLCPRRHEKRQGATAPGPLGPDPWAEPSVPLSRSAMDALLHGVGQELTPSGGVPRQVTGLVDGTALETTARYAGGGHVTRQRQRTAKRGQGHQSEVPVDGWQLIVLIEALTTMPLAAKGVPMQDHAALCPRARVTPAQKTLADHARLRRVRFDRGCVAGAARWWRAQPGLGLVVPAKEHRAVTGEAQALAAAGTGGVARRVHPVAPGPGPHRWTARLETEGVGMAGVTTDEQYGPDEHARPRHRTPCQGHPRNAVVVRQWHTRDDGPGGQGVWLTNEPVDTPWDAFDAYDDRSLLEHGGRQERQQAGSLKPPPQKTARAVQGHGFFPLARCARTMASRVRTAHAAVGDEPGGWQRWRRQLLQQHRDNVIICAQGW